MLQFRVPFSLALLAVAAISGASELKVRLTGREHIDRVEDLKISSTITNAGTKALNILHDPRGLLSDLPVDKFSIANYQNVQPKFIGIRAKFAPTFAVESGAYTTLEPGQSIAVEHDLSKAYDFSMSGAGEYTIRAYECFYVVDASGNVVPSYAETGHHIAKIDAKSVLSRKKGPVPERCSKFVGCTSSQESQIESTIPLTERYAKNAFYYLQSHNNSTPRYTTWFGEYNSGRHGTVLSHFQKISENDFSAFTFNCSCSNPDIYAYVYPDTFGKIHLCEAFWHAPTSGTDSKAGTLIHESSHFNLNGGTMDDTYGQEAAEELAHDDPKDAISNADSHEYFAENIPALN